MGRMIDYEYIVPVRKHASAEERRWAWKFTVLARAGGKCQRCGQEKPLECAHIKAKRDNPEHTYDPANGMALCKRCHRQHDWQAGHRRGKSGWKHSLQTRAKIGAASRRRMTTAEGRAQLDSAREKLWRERRKPDRPCECCGKSLTRPQISRDNRFCSYACCKAYRVGKPRSGY